MIGPLYHISVLSTFVPFLVSTLSLKHYRHQPDQFFLWLFLCLSAATEAIVLTLAKMKVHNIWIFQVYSLLEYVLILILLLNWQKNEKLRKAIGYAIPLYFIIYTGLKISGLEKYESDSYNSLTRPIALLIMMLFGLITLYGLCNDIKARIEQDYRFWILLALAIYFGSSIVLFSFTYTKDDKLLLEIVYVHAILNIIHNILLTIGVIQIRKPPEAAL